MSLTEAAALIKSRRLSPVELTQALLARIDRLDNAVGAFITVTRDEALGAARAAEQAIARGQYRGPLHGIPFGVKDTHYTKGIRTTANTPVLRDFVPDFDATVVARLKSAGGVLLGKMKLPEFSFGSAGEGGAFPDAKNPWNLSRTPGGSSSGSAAALAAGLVTVATGGDTSGSIRNPATFCGVVGMKPTYGRVSRRGIVAISWSLDHVGPMTRTVADNATLLNVIAGHDAADDTSAPLPVPDYTRALRRGVRGMRVGVPKPAQFDDYHADVMRAFHDALAASYHEPFLATRADRYGLTSVRRDVEAGSLIPAVQYLRAQKVRATFTHQLSDTFSRLDVFLTPGMPAPAGERIDVRQPFRRMFNACGFPALVLPMGFSTSPAGLPLGLQIAAKPFDEEAIYAAAQAFESATEWHSRRPALP
ncbi:MAG: Asp-tRNA(Asn)/Glu-tRNA(Gln) amidotransferase GatCAB subunit A [Acidobacteria bacterium]|nr:MAG: Asp-tRNA(Asn)/Glu-tRNA(Gln) amidotransferase GatCAB subunit A [Acidobacteriota bacterium]